MVEHKNDKRHIGINIITILGIVFAILILSCHSAFDLYYHGDDIILSNMCEYSGHFYEESNYDQEIKEICYNQNLALTTVNSNITNATDVFIITMASLTLLASLIYHESATKK